jgi:uncharacterized membrane protein YoaT (DUF817 family)
LRPPYTRGQMKFQFWFAQLLEFTWQELLSCLFPIVIFSSLAFSKLVPWSSFIPGFGRYDFLLVVCILTQYLMWRFKLETTDEMKVIGVFHILGLALELVKVQLGSWSYPEDALSKIMGVPLYSGFMYASIASYICQAWRRFDLRLTGWPNSRSPSAIGLAVYINFFSHHVIPDLRWIIAALAFAVFWRTRVFFWVRGHEYRMPLTLSFVLIGFFVWIAENLGTISGAWLYPHQTNGWKVVDLGKFSSWSLLVIVSLIVVAALKDLKARQSAILERSPSGVSRTETFLNWIGYSKG